MVNVVYTGQGRNEEMDRCIATVAESSNISLAIVVKNSAITVNGRDILTKKCFTPRANRRAQAF